MRRRRRRLTAYCPGLNKMNLGTAGIQIDHATVRSRKRRRGQKLVVELNAWEACDISQAMDCVGPQVQGEAAVRVGVQGRHGLV